MCLIMKEEENVLKAFSLPKERERERKRENGGGEGRGREKYQKKGERKKWILCVWVEKRGG